MVQQRGLFGKDADEVETVTTITRAREYRLVGYRWQLIRDASSAREYSYPVSTVRLPGDAAAILAERIGREPQEHFVVLPLTTRNRVLAVDVVSMGTVNAAIVSPADVFRRVLAHADAAACIVGHNHPSGDPEPSAEDRALTRRLVMAGTALNLAVLDHVIVGTAVPGEPVKHWSFKERGEM